MCDRAAARTRGLGYRRDLSVGRLQQVRSGERRRSLECLADGSDRFLQLLGTHAVDAGLEIARQRRQVCKTEGRRRALDRMRPRLIDGRSEVADIIAILSGASARNASNTSTASSFPSSEQSPRNTDESNRGSSGMREVFLGRWHQELSPATWTARKARHTELFLNFTFG